MAALLSVSAIGACGGDDAEPKPAERAVTEHVGKTGDGRWFVALALDPQGKAKGYLCDGRGRAAVFDGRVRGDRFEAPSADGAARLIAELGAGTVAGSVEFYGQPQPFRLARARGIGGLYTFRYSTQETFTARSERGNEIDGRHQVDRFSAVVTTAEGDSRPLDARLGSGPASQRNYREYRVILLDNGDFRGNRLSGSTLLTTRTVRNRPIISPA